MKDESENYTGFFLTVWGYACYLIAFANIFISMMFEDHLYLPSILKSVIYFVVGYLCISRKYFYQTFWLLVILTIFIELHWMLGDGRPFSNDLARFIQLASQTIFNLVILSYVFYSSSIRKEFKLPKPYPQMPIWFKTLTVTIAIISVLTTFLTSFPRFRNMINNTELSQQNVPSITDRYK